MPNLDFANPLHSFDSSHLTFTANKECYLVGTFFTNTASISQISVNGTPLASSYDSQGYSWTGSLNLKLSVGDVVTSTAASDTIHVFDVVS